MKLALFDDHRPGVVVDDSVVDITDAVGDAMAAAPQERLVVVIERFDGLHDAIERLVASRDGRPLAAVRLRAPLRPHKLLFAQGNYRENWPEGSAPLNIFLKAPSSILDPGGTVELIEDDAVIFHHEAEFAPVIGRRARNLSIEEAMDAVFGYTSLIDVSARALGRGQDLIDKSNDTFCPLGPWVVTKDEIPDPQKRSVRLWVNGQLRQDYNTDDMDYPVAALVSWASEVLTLEPGDVFGCGTNHQGLGPLQNGEHVTLEIEGIGPLHVEVSDPSRRRWPVEIDRALGAAVINLRVTGIRPPPHELFSMKRIG
jgi:2-keto-4-pentenoate hydratase/2-oxohepta-3-ene-1,7-dioic acid hydratase in catechol pathway